MTGEVSVVVTSLAEQQQLLRGGKLRALGMLIPDGFEVEGLGTIPHSFDAYPGLSKYLPISQAIGFAVPADAPDEAKAVLVDAFKKAMATDKVKILGQGKLLPALRQNREPKSKAVFDALESNFAWTLWELGAATVDPPPWVFPNRKDDYE
jgi:tripartite-type tricarboxylate transporter receptor subunit TctC